MATLQNVRRIVEIESKIRKKILSKGHVAKYGFADIIGNSAAIASSIRTAEKFSRVDANVLIYGETGTGKELFAHSMHNASSRSAGPFVAVNCAALPENLLESELFGYVEGAFTGAMKGGKAGLFELAHEGTIFLDEVGEIPLTLQAKLLRVLQEREIMQIGHDRVIPVDLRIIAATNKDLKSMASDGAFRQDILFRLDVLRINVPPLRDRREDVPLLVRRFLTIDRNRKETASISVSAGAMRLLGDYDWPGNVRELSNLCERLSALCEGEEIGSEEVAAIIGCETGPGDRAASGPPEAAGCTEIRTLEREAILSAVRSSEGNFTRAARVLGISRTTLWRKWKVLKR